MTRRPPFALLWQTAAACFGLVSMCAASPSSARPPGHPLPHPCDTGAVATSSQSARPDVAMAGEGVKPSPSALFSTSTPDLRQVAVEKGPKTWTFLVRGEGRQRRAIASLSTDTAGRVEAVVFARLADMERDDGFVAVEHLYGLVLEQAPRATFSVDLGSVRKGGLTHAGALRSIAVARQCAVHQAGRPLGDSPFLAWDVATLQPLPESAMRVGVEVKDATGRPVRNAQVSFSRGDHYLCSAATDANGQARCDLYNPHRDDDDEDARQDRAAPTVASFGGVVGTQAILLPTTFVYRAEAVLRRR